MKIFDPKDKRHIEILREELKRAKFIIESDRDGGMDARMLMRGIWSIIYRDSEYKNTNEMQDFIAKVTKATSTDQDDLRVALENFAKQYPDKMDKLNQAITHMSQPIHNTKQTLGGPTPDEYSANKGRGGYQGD
jgi:hypothetical protein